MCGLRYSWVMGVLSVIGILATAGWAGVSTTGDIKDDGSYFYAGYSANKAGTLGIDSGSVVNRSTGYLGYATGSAGTALITGAGSTWTNSSYLYVGYDGSGTLRVEAGAQVRSGSIGYLGCNAGSTGEAIITGAGSKWTNDWLNVGFNGSGTLTVSDGGVVSAKRLYASLSDLYGNGTITVQGSGILDTNLAFDATHGLTQTLGFGSGGTLQFTIDRTGILGVGYKRSGSLRIAEGRSVTSGVGELGLSHGSMGTAIITGAGSTWTNSYDLYVGRYGSGTLRVEGGAQVSDSYGSLGESAGSTGTAIITGAGSKWTNSSNLFVGYDGSGMLRVEAGGQVSSVGGSLGCDPGSAGMATITGAGSKWTNSGDLYVGDYGRGTLTVFDGGQIAATGLSINNKSTVRLHVNGDRMLVLGDTSTVGSISNSGRLTLLADAFLPSGTYRPVGEYADRNLSWSGGGSTLAVGGTWDIKAGTFTVIDAARVDAGASAAVASGRRLVISDPRSGERAGVSFGLLRLGTTLRAVPLAESERAGLLVMLSSEEMVFSGWDFVGQLMGDEAMVSLEVGLGAEDLRVWRRLQNGWSEYKPEMMTYDSRGIVSFTVDPAALNASGYAVSGVVPEPMGLGMLIIAAGMGLMTRRRRRRRMAVAAK